MASRHESAVAVVAGGVLLVLGGAAAPVSGWFPEPTPSWLREMALDFAADWSEREPTIARVTLGRYPTVVMTGDFDCGLNCPSIDVEPVRIHAQVAAIRADAKRRRGVDSAVCFRAAACLSICGWARCGRARDAVDSALSALAERGVAETFDRRVGRWQCDLGSTRVPATCRTHVLLGAERNVVTFKVEWRPRCRHPVRRRVWRVTESRDGWVHRVDSRGDPFPFAREAGG
jgi:hypothetical protein